MDLWLIDDVDAVTHALAGQRPEAAGGRFDTTPIGLRQLSRFKMCAIVAVVHGPEYNYTHWGRACDEFYDVDPVEVISYKSPAK